MTDLYGFTKEQLFGPSHFRNAGDPRYPKNNLRDLGYKYLDEVEPQISQDLVLRDGKRYVVVETRNLQGTKAIPGKPGWPEIQWVPLTLGKARYFIEDDHPNFFLSPREALQLYCNLMNDLYLDSWIRKGIEIHKQLAIDATPISDAVAGYVGYERMTGVLNGFNDPEGEGRSRNEGQNFFTCFSDFRHRHEIALVRKLEDTYTSVVIRVKHPKITKPPYDHRSEVEQASIPDSAFDFVIDNDGTLEELYAKIDRIVEAITTEGWQRLRGRSLMKDLDQEPA
jgi:hypothetical protein